MLLRTLVFVLGISSVAQARVFDFDRETFAAYFGFSGSQISLGSATLENESSVDVSLSGAQNYNYSGELGFLYSRKFMNVRLGVELFKPPAYESAAKEAGTTLYDGSSEMLGFAPKLVFELNMRQTSRSRSFVALGAGWAQLTLKNSYTLTTDGLVRFPGVLDHSIHAKGETQLLSLSLGHESHFTDTTTIAFEAGYRMMKFDTMKYSRDTTTFSGSHSSGDVLQDPQGRNREFDFSGAFLAINFRFFL